MTDEVMLQQLDGATTHTAWNYCGDRMAAASSDGTLRIWVDLTTDGPLLHPHHQQHREEEPTSSSDKLRLSAQWKAEAGPVLKVVWAPPEYGDAIAYGCVDGSISIWEETTKGEENVWTLCASLRESDSLVLDLQFGNLSTGLKLVAFYADGYARVFETFDVLNIRQWQVQAEFQNAKAVVGKMNTTCFLGASICWRGPAYSTQQPAFVLGCDSSLSTMNSAKVWEFEQSRQRWFCIADLKEDIEEDNRVAHVSWAPNTGRPYEMIAVASGAGVSIWQLDLSVAANKTVSVKRVARLSSFVEKVWQVEWDMSGMTLAISGSDGIVTLWQSNLKGEWQQCAQIDGT